MNAELTFLRRTPKEIEIFGGEVFIDIDGKNIGKLGGENLTVSVPAGSHTVKMYKSHTYDTLIGFAETQIEVLPSYHLLLKYSAPMVVTQPGHIMVTDYDSAKVEEEAQKREKILREDFAKEEKKKEEAQEKHKTAIIIILVLAALCGIVWGIWYASLLP